MNQPPYERINTCSCLRENPDDFCSHILPIHQFIEPDENDPHAKYPCGTCLRSVSNRNKAFQCDVCNFWNHIKCDGILPYDYDKFQKLPQAVKRSISAKNALKTLSLSKNYLMTNSSSLL